MVRPVVIPFVFLQDPAQQHRSRDQNQIGPDDHQDHRPEEPHESGHGLPDPQGDVITGSQNRHAQDAQEPVGLRRFFPGLVRPDQLDGTGEPHLPHRIEINQQEDPGKGDQRHDHRNRGNGKFIPDRAADHLRKTQLRQLGQTDARCQAAAQTDPPGNQGLEKQDPADVPLVHSENAVETELLFASADQRGLGVEQEDQAEEGDDPGPDLHHHRSRPAAGHPFHDSGIPQEMQDVIDGDHQNAGHQERRIQTTVPPHALSGDLRIETRFHFRSPPCASSVSVSLIFWYSCRSVASPL